MNCSECGQPLVNGVCPNAANHADPVAAIGASIRSALGDLSGGIATAVREAVAEVTTPLLEEIRGLRPNSQEGESNSGTEQLPDRSGGPLPGARLTDPSDRVSDPIETRLMAAEEGVRMRRLSPEDARRAVRSNLEMIGMLFEGARELKDRPVQIRMTPELERLYRAHVFERGARIQVARGEVPDESTTPTLTRDMDTQESGYGAELVGAQYVTDLWAAARNQDSIVASIRSFPMSAPTAYVPVDGSLPEMFLVGESTTANAEAYPTSKTGSNRRTFTAKKFTIQQIWSGELNQDSLIAYTPFLRASTEESAALHLGSAMYNGDLTDADTGNINSDDANPANTKHYLAFDGIRHYWLVDDTGNEINKGAALTDADFLTARGYLAGANNSVNALDNINWGQNPDDLRVVADWSTYIAMMGFANVRTRDKYGDAATIVTGELAKIDGIPIISPAYATKTEADGKLSATASNNTKGQATIFTTKGWMRGEYAGVSLYFSRIPRTDQFLLELYTRVAFNRFGADVSAGIRNIG